MAKRGAGNYLTDQNWDQEDDAPEEAGEFVPADQSKMKGRKIIRAVRRTNASSEEKEESDKAGLFKNFTGFTKTEKSAADVVKPTFNFGGATAKTLGGATEATKKPATFGGFSNGSITKSPPLESAEKKSPMKSGFKFQANYSPDNSSTLINGSGSDSKEKARNRYLQKIRGLNKGVSEWIKQHVDKDAYCILTPIFKDYEKYLAEIEKEDPDHGEKTVETTKPAGEISTIGSKSVVDSKTETTTNKETSKEESETTKKPFSFGSTDTSSASDTGFSFGSGGNSKPFGNIGTGSVFGSSDKGSKPFSFGAAVQQAAAASTSSGTQEEEEYVPPKPEVNEVKEDDAFYTKRCKLFYQKEGAWVEKGVGNLHLKKCNEKTQMLMRADTSLGNILLNIMLSAGIPMSRQGKNNVSMMCVPNPPIDPKIESTIPVSMLIRVKTGDDADDLLKILEDNKK